MSKANIERILYVQQELKQRKAFAVIFPSADPHMSEYVAAHWKMREWLSGFQGSAGTLVVTRRSAALWTDGRYFLEAEAALAGSDIRLMRERLSDVPNIEDWLALEFKLWSEDINLVLVDSDSFALDLFNDFATRIKELGLEIRAEHIINAIWKDRPALPSAEIYEISSQFTGESREERLTRLRDFLRQEKLGAFLLSALDEIAWLLHLRGGDVAHNPVFYSYLLVTESDALLCTHYSDISHSLQSVLKTAGIRLTNYGDIGELLREQTTSVAADPASISISIGQLLSDRLRPVVSPVQLWKAQKSSGEIASMRRVMELDGVAMVKLFYWLEDALESHVPISELEICKKIEEFRAEEAEYIGSSFASIVGFQEHGAIIHYSVDEESNKSIVGNGLLLIDSGGQYRGGTTDITRTLAAGQVPDHFRHQYSCVLKGHITLARANFPLGIKGHQLDSLARYPLWKQGMNYGHGTGHGVGFALNVHEGPQNIGQNLKSALLLPGMICSNEPGFYKTKSHGIRIENLVLVEEHPEYDHFLRFETLSLCPLELSLIEPDCLSDGERLWIDTYHEEVYTRLSPYLNTELCNWLERKTRRIQL